MNWVTSSAGGATECSPGREAGVSLTREASAPEWRQIRSETLSPRRGLNRRVTRNPGLTAGATLCRASGACLALILVCALNLNAQQRPLITEDPRLIPNGSVTTELGIGYFNRTRYPI